MAFQVTDTQKAALLGTHEMSSRITVLRGTESLGDIPFNSASVTATYGTQGGRDGRIGVDWSVIEAGYLRPQSDQVIIRTGIKGVVEIPIFTGRVDYHTPDSDQSVDVQLLSRGAEAIRASFEQPWPGLNGVQATSEIARILADVDPTWSTTVLSVTTDVLPQGMVWEMDRGQALDQIAQGASVIWQPDRTGGFVVYDNPYSIGPILATDPVVILRDGEGGVVVDVQDTTSRAQTYNSVTVITERVNNTEPLRVTVRDVGPSETMWGGIFGKQNLVVKNQVPINQGAAELLARRILRQSLALQRSWRITLPHMPLLDPGDVFILWYRDEVTGQVVETIDYSCQADQVTTITSRELKLAETIEEIT